mmetsp:Transcript_68918/g.165410  ORF Transcript_68918/g.165410 Transcript_68918/m.165410 type:complete len:577 (+) Transcript_68918:125-1855(+)
MGANSFRAASEAVVQRAEARVDKSCVATRYHRLPRKLADDYIINDAAVLGRGSTGAVLAATRRGSEQTFAVKTVNLRGVSSETRGYIATEVELFLGMDHPHVTRLFDVYEGDCELNFVMERMEGGELLDRVIQRECYCEPDAAKAAWQMLLCLNYIHSHGIVHRDVKMENFMYVRKDTDHLKLIDFGLSKVWDKSTKMQASCGTLGYIAPEVLDGSYTSQCDLWSFGVVMYTLLAGHMPFQGSEGQQMVLIMSGMYDMDTKEWEKISPDAKDFVQQLLCVDVSKRLTAEQALQHKWLDSRHSSSTGGLASRSVVDAGVVEALRKFSQATKFRRACMSVMAWSLSHEERRSVHEAFLALDKSRQGTIKLWQLRDVLSNTFDVEDKEVAQIFSALDTTHDEEIHYSAFLAAMISSRIALHDKLLHSAFNRFDLDGSGRVTSEGLADLFGQSFQGKDLEDLLQEVNARYGGSLTYNDFVTYLTSGQDDSEHLARVDGANCVIDSKVAQDPAMQTLVRERSGAIPRKAGSRVRHSAEKLQTREVEQLTERSSSGLKRRASSTSCHESEERSVHPRTATCH